MGTLAEQQAVIRRALDVLNAGAQIPGIPDQHQATATKSLRYAYVDHDAVGCVCAGTDAECVAVATARRVLAADAEQAKKGRSR